jgi:ABC-2 type transport system ATP-binding protein
MLKKLSTTVSLSAEAMTTSTLLTAELPTPSAHPSRSPVLAVRGLRKAYGNKTVLRDVTFDVHAGEIFGFLGPNGAGKTTTLEIIEGLRGQDAGEIHVFGLNHRTCLSQIRERLGVSLQKSEYWGQLRVGELIGLFRSFYKKTLDYDVLLDTFDLREKERAFLRDLSGGQRQRVILCLALVNDPELIMLDEPTVGLDPDSRRTLWNILRKLKAAGKTLILTTHYMEEAQVLSDRVAIIHDGVIMCCDTPASLISTLGSHSAVTFRSDDAVDVNDLALLPWCSNALTNDRGVIVYCPDLKAALLGLLNWADEKDISIEDLQIREPSLEDVYLSLTSTALGGETL